MKPQLTELVEIPIKHTSIKNKKHYPVLVTTGSIHEDVCSRIDGFNQAWKTRGYEPLATMSHSQLLKEFINNIKGFLPQPIPDFHRLLGFMINKGEGCLDKDEFALLLESIFVKNKKIKKSDANRTISSAAIITEYAISEYDSKDNYFAKIEAYIMLFSYIFAYIQRNKLKYIEFKNTMELLESALDCTMKALFEEVVKYNGIDFLDPFSEPITRPYRNALLAGLFSAFGLWNCLGGKSRWFESSKEKVTNFIIEFLQHSSIASETFIPHLFMTHLFLRHSGHIKEAENAFTAILGNSVYRKQPDITQPLWNCYISFEDAILADTKIKHDLFETRWESETYTLLPIILTGVSYLMRQELEKHWYDISKLHFMEYTPQSQYNYLFWKNKSGTTKTRIMPQPTSWKRLMDELESYSKSPPLFTKKNIHWLPMFLLVYPQRFNCNFVLGLNYTISKS